MQRWQKKKLMFWSKQHILHFLPDWPLCILPLEEHKVHNRNSLGTIRSWHLADELGVAPLCLPMAEQKNLFLKNNVFSQYPAHTAEESSLGTTNYLQLPHLLLQDLRIRSTQKYTGVVKKPQTTLSKRMHLSAQPFPLWRGERANNRC